MFSARLLAPQVERLAQRVEPVQQGSPSNSPKLAAVPPPRRHSGEHLSSEVFLMMCTCVRMCTDIRGVFIAVSDKSLQS